MNISLLRKKYPKFVYRDYSYKLGKNNFKIDFDFEIEPGIFFNPKITIKNVKEKRIKKIKKKVLDNLVFNLGLVELLSYWKAACSPIIEIQAGFLDKNQIKWWKDLILKGMGQFFYENKINFLKPNFINIETNGREAQEIFSQKLKKRILVPIGGGKDSIVTLEILKKAKNEINCFSLNQEKAPNKIIKISGYKNPIIVERKIDKKLLALNQKGFLNGHTPFSAYLSFLCVLSAALFDYKYIAISQERSSNEGNTKYLGKIINHQYSKSFDFEKKFKKYNKKYLAGNVEYFSFLRPLYEIQIAKLFSKFPQYFSSFLSCNEAYRTYSGTKKITKRWCGNCSKCLFVFAILYPFLAERDLIKIFGENLFEKKELLPIMKELIGEKKIKPFECVGTRKESLAAFYLCLKKWKIENGGLSSVTSVKSIKVPFLLEYFKKNILPKYSNLEKESKKILNLWDEKNNLPKNLEKILKNT